MDLKKVVVHSVRLLSLVRQRPIQPTQDVSLLRVQGRRVVTLRAIERPPGTHP